MRIVLDAGIVQLFDVSLGVGVVEPAVVAIDRHSGLPFRAGWAALDGNEVRWPLEDLERAGLGPDAEPRRCLLGHLLRTALARRPWWDRILRPRVTLVVPPGLPARAIRVLRSDARLAGAARNVRMELIAAAATSATFSPSPVEGVLRPPGESGRDAHPSQGGSEPG